MQRNVIILFFILSHIVVNAQIYNFEQYSLAEGLSQSQVFDIKQDHLGRVWLATELGGITILSGDFPQYIDRTEGLPGRSTFSLFHDNQYRMWIGTDKGVRYFNGKKLVSPLNGELLDTMYIWDITQRTDGTIVMATNQGVYGYNDSVGCFNLIPQLTNTQVSKVAARTNNLIYIMVYNKPLLIFNGYDLEEVKLPLSQGANIELCFFDSQDRIWVGTTRGLITRDEYYYKTYTTNEGLNDDHIISLAEDRFGNIWVGTDEGGISIISNDSIINITAQQGIGYNRIYALYCDYYKNMWVGTDGAGAYVFKGLRFVKMHLPEFIETTSIISTHITNDQMVCIGSNGYGLLTIQDEQRRVYSRNDGLSSDIIRAIASDEKGTIYVGSNRGLDVIKNGKVNFNIRQVINIKEPIVKLFMSNDGLLWVGTYGHGLYRVKNNEVKIFNQTSGLSGNLVYDIIEDKHGTILVATNEGLSVIAGETISNYTTENGLLSNNLTSLVIDKNENLWAISSGGLTLLNRNHTYQIRTEELSDANIIISGISDQLGNLILGTERGLNILTLDDSSKVTYVTTYRKDDGFFGVECNLNAVSMKSANEIFFGTKQGVTIFDPLADSIQYSHPRPYIRDIELFYQKVDWYKYTDSVADWTLIPYNLNLPYSENNLTFYFSANDYQNPQKLMFQFYLEGFDIDWLPVTKQRSVNYTNLPPGKYSMRFRTLYDQNELSTNEASFDFIIKKPFFTTFWFIAVVFIALFMFIALIWTMRVRAIRRNEYRLEAIVKDRTHDLKMQKEALEEANIKIRQGALMKEQFLANTSHEIRTPLNVISGYVNLLLNTHMNNIQQKYLKYIKESSENLKVIVGDILDFSKIEADKLELESVSFDFVKAIRTTCNHLDIEATKQNLVLELSFHHIHHSVILGDPVRLNQIIVNLVRNAIKFTKKGSIKVCITDLSTDREKVILKIDVIDQGIGIPKENLETIFDSFSQVSSDTTRKFGGTGLGLSIVKRLAEKQNGSISVMSVVGEGSRFTVEIPYRVSDIDPMEENKLDYLIEPHALSKDVKILLVDDNEINLAIVENTLQSFSSQFNIHSAMTGAEAIDRIKKEHFDLIIMDIQMPIMDGYTATRIIRNELPKPNSEVPILGMTAHAMRTEKEKCLNLGMNDYITKPFIPRLLFETVLQLTKTKALSSDKTEKTDIQAMPMFIYFNPTQLWRNALGYIDRFNRYLGMYVQEIPKQLKELELSINNSNYNHIQILSHTLKTSFRYLGIPKAQSASFEMEQAVSEEKEFDYLKNLNDIKTDWEIVLLEIKRYFELS